MKVGIGKYNDKSVAVLVLKEPRYVGWVLYKENLTGPLADVEKEMRRLIEVFDSKPYQKSCRGRDCNRSATYCTVYQGNVYKTMWWCDECDPYQGGAVEGGIVDIRRYYDAVKHCYPHHYTKKQDPLKDLVKTMAMAKGLPQRVGEKQAAEFFEE